jgi:hypothetical protein
LNKKQEMRQFTEFGVSLPDLLAEKYTKAEGRIVTAGDVIERVSKRMVSFNDVKDVLWQSTDKGGKFYGMQNVLAQSTSGMASNLKDAIDTMYYDIANSNSGVIKGAIKDITELVSHWRELTSVLTAGTAAYGLYWSKMAIYNRWVGLNNNSTIKSIMLQKQEEASILRKASKYRTLTSMESERLMMSKQLTLSDLKQLAADGALSSEQLIKLARTRQITAAQALEVSSLYGLNEAQMAYLRGLQTSGVAMSRWQKLMNTQFITRMRIGIKNLVSSIITLPNILMAAGAALMYFFVNNSQKQEQIAQDRLQFMKDMEDGAKTLKEFADSNPIDSIIKKGDTNEIGKAISAYKEQLQNSPIDMSSIITNADAIDDDVKKLEALRQAVIDLKNAKDAASNTGSILSGMMDKQDGFFSEPVKDNYEDMVKSFSNVSLNMSNITKGEISKTLDYLKKIPSLKNLSSQFDNIKNSGDSVVEMMMQLGRINEQTGGTIEALVKQSGSYQEVLSGIGNTRTYLDDANTFWGQIKQGLDDTAEAYRANGIDLKHTSQQNIDQYLIEVDAQGKALGLQGDNLIKYRLMAEQNLDMRDTMKNHAQAWQLLFEEVKNQLIKSKTPIETASKENIIAAEKVAINNLRSGEFGAQLNSALNYISSNLNPIAIRLQIMGGNVNANTLYNDMAKRWRDKYGYMVNLPSYAMPTTEDLGQYRSDLKTNIENSKKNLDTFKKHYGEASRQYKDERERLDNYLAAQSLAGFGGDNSSSSTGGKKGHVGTGGSKTDQFLKDIQTQAEMIKKAVDVYKQGVQSGESQLASIGDIEKLGIFPKGTFDKITSEDELNKWYKNRLDSLVNALRKAKTSNERKKELSTLLADSLSFDRDEFKHEWDSKKQAIEEELKTITEQWGNYKSMYNITGNKSFSAMSAFGNGTLSFDNMGEVLKNMVQKTVGNKNTFDQLLGMTEQQIKAKYSGSSEILIELVNKYKEYTKSERSEEEKLYEDSVKSTMGYYAKIEQITADYNRRISIARKNNNPILANKLESEKQTKIDALNPQYMLFYQSALNFTKDKAREIGQALKDGLVKQMQDGTISAHDYAETIEKINKLLEESEKRLTPLQSFMDSGINGYFKNIYEAGQRKIDNGSSMQKQGMEMYDKYSQIFNSSSMGSQQQLDSSGKMLAGKQMMVSGQNMQAMGQSMQELSSKGAMTIAIIDRIIKAIDQTIQAINQATQSIAEMEESFGVNTNKGSWLVFKSFTSGMSEFSSKAKAGWESLKSGDIAGAISNNISAYASIFTNFNKLHDKKLQNKIDDLAQQITEESLAIKKIEDALKYHLGNAANDYFINTSEVQKFKQMQQIVDSTKRKQKLQVFDLLNLKKANAYIKEHWATAKYLDKNDKDNYGNAYNYQRNLYKDSLEKLKQQESDEEHKKHSDQSKINDYNSRIQEMETKITQFSEDLANSLYGIDIKGWASQFGDALFEAWQKGESGAEAFNKTAASILQNLVKSWFKTNVIENAFKGLQKDLFGEDGQGGIFGTDNDLTQEDISKIASDIMSAQGDITSKMNKLDELYAALEKKGIDIKGNSSSSTTNAISGVSEQEANIIAAYMDAIRQDTYNNRMNLLKIVENGVKIESSPMMQAQLLQLQQIQSNTYRNMELVGDIKSMFNDVILGNKKIYVN